VRRPSVAAVRRPSVAAAAAWQTGCASAMGASHSLTLCASGFHGICQLFLCISSQRAAAWSQLLT
jgi:hypothetical protein